MKTAEEILKSHIEKGLGVKLSNDQWEKERGHVDVYLAAMEEYKKQPYRLGASEIVVAKAWDKKNNCWLNKPFVVDAQGRVFFEYVGGGKVEKDIEVVWLLKDKSEHETQSHQHAELLEALNSLLNPDLTKYSQPCGCPMCDYGKLRSPEKEHWENCNWNNARKVYEKSKATVK